MFPIDLRSDTVTKPTVAMRKAMANAEVGDDVFGEDPTANRLQERVAEILGKEAALFVPSGTMGNQICLAAQTRPGDEVLLDENAHIFNYEGGAPALLAGLQLRTLPGDRGRLKADQIANAVRGGASHLPPTTLVTVENTHNRAGGSVYDLGELQRIYEIAQPKHLIVHMDGARLWNAAVALGCPEANIARFTDSVSVCFSKGLGAPVGSAVAGSRDFIKRAHRFRKLFGGGARQVGILAAGALHALENHRARLADDHAHARILTELLLQNNRIQIDLPVETNIIMATLTGETVSAPELVTHCARDGVLFFPEGQHRFRLVTHLDVPAEAIEPAAKIILKNLAQ
ncbi:aminotransferase class I/II-fold pyridoxal phosphate-dependent enzyme [candidate division KSB1 bacterium]|nr:MAG: aminotransferase class I/II-fold pyridoxal phosphate-dependent enzyme [candidate division KSB1 bacterium]